MTEFNEREIRKRIEKRIRQRQEFIQHLTIYGMVNAFLWVVWIVVLAVGAQLLDTSTMPYTALQLPWPLFVMMAWGIGLVAHGMEVYFKSGRAEANREKIIQRELERERERLGILSEKPKRESRISLDEDGELIYEDEKRSARRSRDD